MDMNFCRRCGTKLTHKSDSAYTCANDHPIYTNPIPSVGVFFVTPDLRLLLAVRGVEPHKGMLDAFGGIVDISDESLEAAARRELQEELSLSPTEYEPLQYLTSFATPYDYKHETLRVMSALYWTRLKTDRSLTAADDVAAIKSVPLSEVDLTKLHADDIRKGVKALQQLLLTNKPKDKQTQAIHELK